jgi:hypothetical protein
LPLAERSGVVAELRSLNDHLRAAAQAGQRDGNRIFDAVGERGCW